MTRWIASSLSRKLALAVSAAMGAASLVFLALFLGLYQAEIARERSETSLQINRLLQASLENAMLKRDLEGLRAIVQRLGEQEGVRRVMITNPDGEVRFSSQPDLVGQSRLPGDYADCVACPSETGEVDQWTSFGTEADGQEILRSINPVRNKAACTQCHGPVPLNPVNGILYVDYDAAAIKQTARQGALLLVGSGAIVVLVALGGAWWFTRRNVLQPIGELAAASRALAVGRSDARASLRTRDELGKLGDTFNEMAGKLQRNLQEIERRDVFLQSLIDAVPDGIRVIDEDYTILQANKAYCRQLGYRLGEVVGLACHQSSHDRQEPCPPTMAMCPLYEIRRNGRPVKTIQQHICRDGSAVQVEVIAAPLRVAGKGGERTVIVESIRDLTKHLQVSQEQRLAEMDQLASGVAHEIHNPLASIRLALQAALRSKDGGKSDTPELYRYLETMDGEIDRCIEITERLLRLSSPPDERPQLVAVNEAVSETLSLLVYEAERKGIAVKSDLDAADPRVLAGDSEIRMLVLNLAQNAFHAMPDGGSLQVTSRRQDDDVEIGFVDTGVGIQPQDIPYIFDPFFSRRADGVKGTGLGLTICKAVAERYGGRMDVRSRAGEGSEFRVTFPSAEKAGAKRGHLGDEAEHPAH